MNSVILAPIIRGAYLEAGAPPLIVLFDKNENPHLPKLPLEADGLDAELYDSAQRSAELELANQIRKALESSRIDGNFLPAGVQVPGLGCFYAGATMEDAEKARSGGVDRLSVRTERRRSDVVRGRIALVTGGAQGFGAEIARGLADEGAFVIVADINGPGVQAVAAELNTGGTMRAAAVAVDVSDEESVKDMASALVEKVGGLDLLVSNAGVLRAGSVLEQPMKDFEFVTKINYSAFFLVVKQCAPIMVRQHAAAPSWTTDIIQINSKSGLTGSNKNGAYAGGKFGGIGLVQSFALELVKYGIKVNAVCPGNFFDGPLWSDPERGLFVQYLNTGKVPGAKSMADVKKFYEAKVPMGRGCEGPDVLKAILYSVEQEYETGQAIPVTGGQVMLG